MQGFSSIFTGRLLLNIIGIILMLHVIPAIAADATECTVNSASENVVVIVCPPTSDIKANLTAWKSAGEKACSLNPGICNAWIWDDPKKAPSIAPATDVELSKAHILQAVAIWDNNKQSLVVLRKVEQKNQ